MSLPILPVDFSRRTILPAAVAVSCPPFTDADHQRSALVRDILDTLELDSRMPPPPPPAAEVSCESIILEGHEIRSRYTTSGMIVSQQRSVAFATDAPLELAAPPAFEREPSLTRRRRTSARRLEPTPVTGAGPRGVRARSGLTVAVHHRGCDAHRRILRRVLVFGALMKPRALGMAFTNGGNMFKSLLIFLVTLSATGCASPVAGQTWGQALRGVGGQYVLAARVPAAYGVCHANRVSGRHVLCRSNYPPLRLYPAANS